MAIKRTKGILKRSATWHLEFIFLQRADKSCGAFSFFSSGNARVGEEDCLLPLQVGTAAYWQQFLRLSGGRRVRRRHRGDTEAVPDTAHRPAQRGGAQLPSPIQHFWRTKNKAAWTLSTHCTVVALQSSSCRDAKLSMPYLTTITQPSKIENEGVYEIRLPGRGRAGHIVRRRTRSYSCLGGEG